MSDEATKTAPASSSSSSPPSPSSSSSASSSSSSSPSILLLLVLLLLSPIILLVFALYVIVTSPCTLCSDYLAEQPGDAQFSRHFKNDDNKQLANTSSALLKTPFNNTDFFKGATGIALHRRIWVPSSSPSGVLFIVHGFGEHCSRLVYQSIAAQLSSPSSSSSYVVVGWDHAGHGYSLGRRAHFQRMQHAVDDMSVLINNVAESYANLPIMLYGHSMGGLITLIYLTQLFANTDKNANIIRRLRGAVLSAAATRVDEKVATPPLKLAAKVLGRFCPNLALDGLPADTISRNKTAVKAYEQDQLIWHGGVRARLAAEMLYHQSLLNSTVGVISSSLPVMLQHGTGDSVVPLAASQFVYDSLRTPNKLFQQYPGAYHEVGEDEEHGATYMNDILQFVRTNMPAGVAESAAESVPTSSNPATATLTNVQPASSSEVLVDVHHVHSEQ